MYSCSSDGIKACDWGEGLSGADGFVEGECWDFGGGGEWDVEITQQVNWRWEQSIKIGNYPEHLRDTKETED